MGDRRGQKQVEDLGQTFAQRWDDIVKEKQNNFEIFLRCHFFAVVVRARHFTFKLLIKINVQLLFFFRELFEIS